MIRSLIRKEILTHLMDRRFLSILVLALLLGLLSIFTGLRNLSERSKEFHRVTSDTEQYQEDLIERGKAEKIRRLGISWNRPPEPLSLIVFGLEGKLGRSVNIYHQKTPVLESSLFSIDPAQVLFGLFDFGFIVQFILSLSVLLLIYDVVSGEKEAGTLSLYTSFPIPRATIALAKLTGSVIAVLLPLILTYLLTVAVLSLTSDLDFNADDWLRLAAILLVYCLYLLAFSSFGILVSASCKRSLTAFLILLGLWFTWIFIVPNLAVYISRTVFPLSSHYAHEMSNYAKRWQITSASRKELNEHWANVDQENFYDLPNGKREKIRAESRKIWHTWDEELYTHLGATRTTRRNRMKLQNRLTSLLSSISPLGAASLVSTDLARTGIRQEEKLHDALDAYQRRMSSYLREKWDPYPKESVYWTRDLSDFERFSYTNDESVWKCLSRNTFYILNLLLISILGFTGAFIALLRYDVR